LGTPALARVVAVADGGDRDHPGQGGCAKGREQGGERPTHDEVLDEPERATPRGQHGLPQSPHISQRRATAAAGVLLLCTTCGIVGYTCPRQAAPLLLEGLK